MSILNKKSYVLLAAGLITMSVPAASYASALATSTLQMSNFTITHSNGSVYDVSDFTGLAPGSSANIAATYNGTSVSDGLGPTPTGQIDLQPVCSGPACPGVANNVFPAITPPPVGNFVAADQNESGSPITGQVDASGNPIAAGATVESGSWANIGDSSFGPNTASSTNQLSATWTFSLAQSDSMTFAFDALIYQESWVSLDGIFPSNAQTSSQFQFTITGREAGTNANLGTFFDWTPTTGGTNVNNEAAPFTLNGQTAINSPYNGADLLSCITVAGTKCSGKFSATTNTLANVDANGISIIYTLKGTLKTTAAAISVPEPGILALMGIGLVGLAATQRYKGGAKLAS